MSRLETHIAESDSGGRQIGGTDFRFRCKLGSTLVEVTLHSDIQSVESEWREFERVADCTAFQSYDWLSTWQRHIGSRSNSLPAVVIGRSPDRAQLFIFPLALQRGLVNRLTWLGSDLCDYNAPLIASEFSARISTLAFEDLWSQILDLLNAAFRVDVVQFEKMPESVGRQRNPFMQLTRTTNPNGAYLSNLFGTWDEFYAARRSSSRKKGDRNRARRLAEHGPIELVSPRSKDEITATMHVLFEQKTQSLSQMGVADLFARPGYKDFYLDLATNPASKGLIHVSRLEVDTVWAATNFGLTFRGSYYHVLCSYERGKLAPFGPGTVHLRELLRYAIDQRLERFDFTIGDEPYKLEWSDTRLQLYDHFSATSFLGYPIKYAIHTRQTLKRRIKQSRILWAVIERVRRLGGASRPKDVSQSRQQPTTKSEKELRPSGVGHDAQQH